MEALSPDSPRPLSHRFRIDPANVGAGDHAMRILDYTSLAGLHFDCRQALERLGKSAAQLRLCEEKVFRIWGPNEVAINTGRSQVPSPGRVGCVDQNNPTSERAGDPPPVTPPTS